MNRMILFVAFVFCSGQTIASKIVTFKTVINEKILPAFFPADKAMAWSKVYFDSARSLLAFHCNASTMKLEPADMDFAIVRNTTQRGRIAKWINHKWVATANEHEYTLSASEKKKIKIICDFSCYRITFWDAENKRLCIGWVTEGLPVNAGILWIKNLQGAVLGYENEKEQTYAQKIENSLHVDWIAEFKRISIAALQPIPKIVEVTGEEKRIEKGHSFPRFKMVDLKGNIWDNSDLVTRKIIMVVWADLPAVDFDNGVIAETDFAFLERLQKMISKSGKKNVTVIAPTFTSKIEIVGNHPDCNQLSLIHIVPDAEKWMRTKVKIKKFPTVIMCNEKGVVSSLFEFTHGKEEYEQFAKLINTF